MERDLMLAIDVGGTKLAAGVVRRDGELLSADSSPSLPNDADGLFQTLVALCHRTLERATITTADLIGIGVGSAGPMEYPAGIISPLNLATWRHRFPLRPRLEETFQLPTVVDNDAKALALGEYWKGAGQGARHFMGMVASTGVGGGIVINGRLVHGRTGNAGHVGHINVWRNGPPCGCGSRGCVEGIASGSGISRRARAAIRRGVPTVLTGDPSAEDVARAALAGDRLSQRLYHAAGTALGVGIASAAALLDLDRVVISGGVASSGPLLWDPLLAAFTRTAKLDFSRHVPILPSTLRVQASLIGAAALVFLGEVPE